MIAVSLLFGASALSVQADDNRSGTVYRGLHPAGMWLELGDDGNNSYALSIIDGMPGFAAEPLTVPMRTDTSASGCRLVPLEPGVNISVEGCPGGGAVSANVVIGAVTGNTILQPVGWSGSFVWGEASRPLGPVRQSCSLQRLRAAEALVGTVLQPSLAALATEASAMPVATTDPAQVLPRLRSERLRAYSMLQLSEIEAQQAQRIEDAVAGRPVLGRRIPMSEATQQKNEFDARVTNSPQRQQARQELLQIDRALAEIYDVSAAGRRNEAVSRLQRQTAPAALVALDQVLAARQPSRIDQLVGLEGMIGELDVCMAAISPGSQARAHTAVRQSLVARSGELAEALRIAMANAADSAAANTALAQFEGNQVIRDALQTGGQGAALTGARNRVTQLAQAEQQAREAEARRVAAAEAAAERAANAATSSGGSRGLQVGTVSRSVVYVMTRSGTGSGFIVAPGVVVTNVHVIEGFQNVEILVNGRRYRDRKPGRVIAQYPIHDIAVVRVEDLDGQIARIATADPAQGSRVWAFGFPGLAHSFDVDPVYSATLTEGIVSRPLYEGITIQSERRGTTRLVQHTAEISPGNSGGPLFDACNRVVGVNTQMSSERSSQILVSVSSGILPELLRQAGVTPAVSAGRC